MYNCLFVGFMWVRTSKSWFLLNLSPLYKVTSENVSSVSLDSYYVNLIVGCSYLIDVSHKCCEFGCVSGPNDKNVGYEPFP